MIIASNSLLLANYRQYCRILTSIRIKPRYSIALPFITYIPNQPSNSHNQSSKPNKINMNLLPGADQLLPLAGRKPHILVLHASVSHVTSTHTTSKGKNDQNGVGTCIRKPNVVFELIPVFGNVLVKVSAWLNGHGAAGGDGACPVERKVNGELCFETKK